MFNNVYEEIKVEYHYMEEVRLRKALIVLGYLNESAYERLYFNLVTMNRVERKELLQRIRLAYKEIK